MLKRGNYENKFGKPNKSRLGSNLLNLFEHKMLKQHRELFCKTEKKTF